MVRGPFAALTDEQRPWEPAAVGATKRRAPGGRRFTSAVGAARRLPCGTRARGPAPNSLRSLRSLRSHSGAEFVDEARSRARPRALRSSAPPRRAAPRAHAASRDRRALRRRAGSCGRTPPTVALAAGDTRCGRTVWRRAAQAWGRRAQRASCTDSRTWSERSEPKANAASSAARPRAEQRSAVVAQRRPPQGEPAAGAACRDAPTGQGQPERHAPYAAVGQRSTLATTPRR